MTPEQKALVRFVKATDWLDPDNEELRIARKEAANLVSELQGNRNIHAFYAAVLE